MWSYDRRRVTALLLATGLTGCGYQPVYRSGGQARALMGKVHVPDIRGRAGHYLVRTLRRRLGPPDPAAEMTLEVDLNLGARDIVVGPRNEILRYEIWLRAKYLLSRRTQSEPVAQGVVEVVTSVDATESPYAAYAAERNRTRAAATEAGKRIIRAVYTQLEAAAQVGQE